jgi:hypothetical protein
VIAAEINYGCRRLARTIDLINAGHGQRLFARGVGANLRCAAANAISASQIGRDDMTILMTSDMPGVDEEGYEHLAAALMTRLRANDGFISHAAAPIDGGYRVTELWESADAHRTWFQASVIPNVAARRPGPPNRHSADHHPCQPRLT